MPRINICIYGSGGGAPITDSMQPSPFLTLSHTHTPPLFSQPPVCFFLDLACWMVRAFYNTQTVEGMNVGAAMRIYSRNVNNSMEGLIPGARMVKLQTDIVYTSSHHQSGPVPLICNVVHYAHSYAGIFYGKNPLEYNFTLMLLEISMVIIISRLVRLLLERI